MRPIIVTTPRSGSTLITDLLGNIAKEHAGYKNTLQEYFTITELYYPEFKLINDTVYCTSVDRKLEVWYDDKRTEILKRLSLLNNDHNYMIKLFSEDIEPEVQSMIDGNYDIIYLERRDKLSQYISYMNMIGTNIAHHTDSSNKVKSIIYWSKFRDEFIHINDNYFKYKTEHPSKFPTIYYEDFIDGGSDEEALLRLLNLDLKVYNKLDVKTIPTPYENDLESLILNKKDWLLDREYIINELYKNM